MGTPSFITDAVCAQLIADGHRSGAGEDINPAPLVKLLMPGTTGTRLLTEIEPRNPDLAFGLCDLGLGCPELGYVSLHELTSVRSRLGLNIEADKYFVATQPLSVYAEAARQEGGIVEPVTPPSNATSLFRLRTT